MPQPLAKQNAAGQGFAQRFAQGNPMPRLGKGDVGGPGKPLPNNPSVGHPSVMTDVEASDFLGAKNVRQLTPIQRPDRSMGTYTPPSVPDPFGGPDPTDPFQGWKPGRYVPPAAPDPFDTTTPLGHGVPMPRNPLESYPAQPAPMNSMDNHSGIMGRTQPGSLLGEMVSGLAKEDHSLGLASQQQYMKDNLAYRKFQAELKGRKFAIPSPYAGRISR